MSDSIDRLRRRLITGGAAAFAGAGLGTFGRSALAQAATVDLPIVNGIEPWARAGGFTTVMTDKVET